MVLTPLGRPTGNHDSYGIFEFTGILQHGMFPSGHQMLATLAWLLVDGTEHPRLKSAAGAIVLLEGLALLLSRGHYSIDVVGGSLVAWFIFERLSRYRDRFLLTKAD
jgi:membrane-associated phospholipid phosphatase